MWRGRQGLVALGEGVAPRHRTGDNPGPRNTLGLNRNLNHFLTVVFYPGIVQGVYFYRFSSVQRGAFVPCLTRREW